ncbi:MAG: aldose 1-epimerase family protein [Clostridia bacterium]|nr:aldose 1-epimerase family protein [Clostridia bacterium]
MIEIKTKPQGAEIISIKVDGKEKLHDGKKDWNRNAPVLFPIVGQIKDGETIIEGKTYKMGQHGFARDMEFEQIADNTYILKYNKETLEKYPYKFELTIAHKVINETTVETEYQIKNLDSKKIYFGLGGHPAFICDYKNAEIEFEKEENKLQIYQLQNGLIKEKPENSSKFTDGKTIKLNSNIFDNDAIIMKNLKSNKITLKENGKTILKFDFTDFPILAIWSKKDANFLCIEPWFNTADTVNHNGKYIEKEGIISLEPQKIFKAKFKVEFK